MGIAVSSLGDQSSAAGVTAPDEAWGARVPLASTRPGAPGRPSARTALVRLRFGVPPVGRFVSIAPGESIHLGNGRLVFLTGPSGSGKSSTLSAIEAHFVRPSLLVLGDNEGDKAKAPKPSPSLLNVQRIEFSIDGAIIDEVAPDGDLADAASLLTACGLGEAALWLRPYVTLSEGEKFRARLARAISLQPKSSTHLEVRTNSPPSQGGPQGGGESTVAPPCKSLHTEHLDALSSAILLCDEFCSGLHRRVAKAIAHNLRKLVTRRGLCIVVACSTDDLTPDLDPDTVVEFAPPGRCRVSQRNPRLNAALSLGRKLRIEPGLKSDYETFAAMHYRDTDELGFVDRVFVLREGASGPLLGIVVYSHPALELSLRNKATNGWFSRNPQRVNKHLRILRRLVIHPDVRGCGLGHFLVRKTMPLLGTEYVECLAAMGEFNPVFERAGMVRIGQYDVPHGPKAALELLRTVDVDPQSADFGIDVARRPAVRKVVAQAVADWYAATTAGGEKRAVRQSPETLVRTFRGLIGVRPVYYLWRRGDENVLQKNKIFPNKPIFQSQ